MQEGRFNLLTGMVNKQLGSLEFTALVARSLDISFEEAQQWFKEAIQKRLLVQSRHGSNWASIEKDMAPYF